MTASSGTWSYTTPTLSDGSHTLKAEVTVTDSAGNSATVSDSDTITIDTVAPSASVTMNNLPSIDNDPTQSLSGTATSGSTVKIYDGSTLLGSVTASSGTWSYTTPTLSDGSHTLKAQVTRSDSAGNSRTVSDSDTITIDTLAPSVYVTMNPLPSNSDDPSQTPNGTATPGSTVKIYDGSTLLGSAPVINGTWSFTTDDLNNGSHTLKAEATATDAAGNSATDSVSDTTNIDARIVLTKIDLLSSSDSGVSSTDNITDEILPTVRISFTGGRVGVYDHVAFRNGNYLKGTEYLSQTDIDRGYKDITTESNAFFNSDGVKNLIAKSVDDVAGGPEPTLDITIDTKDPTLTISDNISGTATGNITFTFQFSEDISGFTNGDIVVTNGSKGSFSKVDDDTYTLVVSPPAEDSGTTTVTVANNKYIDIAGNSGIGDDGNQAYNTVTTQPLVLQSIFLDADSDTGAFDDDRVTKDITPTVKVQFTGGEAGDQIKVWDGSTLKWTTTLTQSQINQKYVNITYSSMTQGSKSLKATSTASSSDTNTITITIDTVAPTVSVGNYSATGGGDLYDLFTDVSGSYTTSLSGYSAGAYGFKKSGAGDTTDITFLAPIVRNGTAVYSGTLTATDRAGNEASDSFQVTIFGGVPLPIILDLDGDGVELVSPMLSTVTFDMDLDGVLEQAGWAAADDGFLALDRNDNGTIDDISEISFVDDVVGAETDLEGLAAYDSDGDGLLTAGDARFGDFFVWQDANQNGISEAAELKTLAELGVESIDLTIDRDETYIDGNVMFQETPVTYSDGSVGVAGDVGLGYFEIEPEDTANGDTDADSQASAEAIAASTDNQVVAENENELGYYI